MNTFSTSPSHAGYGARIWLRHHERDDIKIELNHLSKWGGVDKSDGEWAAWEFGEEQYEQAIDFLTKNHNFGYERRDQPAK